RDRHAPLRGRSLRDVRAPGRGPAHRAAPAPDARVEGRAGHIARLPAGYGERVAGVAAPIAGRPGWRFDPPSPACPGVLAVGALRGGEPRLLALPRTSRPARRGQAARDGLAGGRAALAEPALRSSLWNTLMVTLVRQLLSLPLAVFIAWLLARTDLPGRRWIEFAFWAAFFLPPLTVTLSWILLLDPEYGLINTSLAA